MATGNYFSSVWKETVSYYCTFKGNMVEMRLNKDPNPDLDLKQLNLDRSFKALSVPDPRRNTENRHVQCIVPNSILPHL